LNFRQLLVTQRVQLQNHVRGVLVAQGLTAPRGHRAWTGDGMNFWDDLARAPESCPAEELWRAQSLTTKLIAMRKQPVARRMRPSETDFVPARLSADMLLRPNEKSSPAEAAGDGLVSSYSIRRRGQVQRLVRRVLQQNVGRRETSRWRESVHSFAFTRTGHQYRIEYRVCERIKHCAATV
jgi:hypothetical protein